MLSGFGTVYHTACSSEQASTELASQLAETKSIGVTDREQGGGLELRHGLGHRHG